MALTTRHVQFLSRWYLAYNFRLVWLNMRLPGKLPSVSVMDPDADALRRKAHSQLAEGTSGCQCACGGCGRCCLEKIDRFTAFDHIVRLGTPSPAPSWDKRIYSVPWMIWNAVSHTFQRLFLRSKPVAHETCVHLSNQGCGLSREDRPMICVSWFCPKYILSMDTNALNAVEEPLRVIEKLHIEALRVAKIRGTEK